MAWAFAFLATPRPASSRPIRGKLEGLHDNFAIRTGPLAARGASPCLGARAMLDDQSLSHLLTGLLVAVLGWMAKNVQEISRSLAVVVSKIEDHEKRIDKLEGGSDKRR